MVVTQHGSSAGWPGVWRTTRAASCYAQPRLDLDSLSAGRMVDAPFTPLVVAFDPLATDVLENAPLMLDRYNAAIRLRRAPVQRTTIHAPAVRTRPEGEAGRPKPRRGTLKAKRYTAAPMA